MSKPTDAVERAKAAVQTSKEAFNALSIAEAEGVNFEDYIIELLADHAATEVERELAAYRERLRSEVEAMESFSGDIIDRADVLELIGIY